MKTKKKETEAAKLHTVCNILPASSLWRASFRAGISRSVSYHIHLSCRLLSQVFKVKGIHLFLTWDRKALLIVLSTGELLHLERARGEGCIQCIHPGVTQKLVLYCTIFKKPLINQMNAACMQMFPLLALNCGSVHAARVRFRYVTVSSVTGSLALEGDQSLTFDTEQRSDFSYYVLNGWERDKKKSFYYWWHIHL